MIGIQDEKLNDMLLKLLVSVKNETNSTKDTIILAMMLLNTEEKIVRFAYWARDFVKAGNPYKIDSEMIEKVANMINLGMELPTPTMENNS